MFEYDGISMFSVSSRDERWNTGMNKAKFCR
jgi:hypothetical protein